MLRIQYGDKYFNDPQLTIECETAWSEDGETRIGTVERWNIRDHVTGASADEVNAALNEFKSALAIDGQDLVLTGPSEMQSMRAADIERGPKVVKNTLLDEESVYRTTVWFTVLFEGFRAVVQDGIIDRYYTHRYETDESGLHVQSRKGFVRTESGTSALSKYPGVKPDTPEGYVVAKESYSVDDDDTLLKYEIAFRELHADLPEGTTDGFATTSTYVDEDGLQRVTVRGKFAGSGAMGAAQSYKPTGGNVFISEQEIESNDFDGSVRFKYVYLLNANDDPGDEEPNLLAFTETLLFRTAIETPRFVTINAPNQPPYKFVGGSQTYQVEQFGTAVGLEAYPEAPDAIYDAAHYSERPVVTYHAPVLNTDKGFINWKVEWKYSYEFADEPDLNQRPTKRTIY
jgi:hypothetical protein